MKLTVLIPTYNCESIIKDCLESVKNIADEVLIADSFSKDGTLEIAGEYGARIIQRKYNYSASQKNWAIPQAKNEWVLLIDSDERLSEKLKREIASLKSDPEKADLLKNISGFKIARRHVFLGKWLRFGGRYPLYNIRLFKKSCRYEDRNVHAHILLSKSRMGTLKGDIIHLSDRNLEQILEKVNRYSTYQANYMIKRIEQKTNINWREFFTNSFVFKAAVKDIWFHISFSPLFRFAYMYILRLGFLDGREGLLVAMLYGFEDFVGKNKYKQMLKEMRPEKFGFFLRLRLAVERLGYQVMGIK